MSSTFKVLGQVAPSATTETAAYTVPADTSAVCSTMVVCNRGAATATFRVSVSAGGGVTSNKDYLYYDLSIAPLDTFAATIGATLAETDIVRVYASTGDLSFNFFGSEVV